MARNRRSEPTLEQATRTRDRIARRAQKTNDQSKALAKYTTERLEAIKRGVPESSLMAPHSGMDLRAANERLSFATGGRGSAAVSSGPGVGGLSRDWMGKEGISSPPPTGPQGPQQITQIPQRNPKDAANPRATGRESAADYAGIQQRNAETYAPSDRVVTRTPPRPQSDLQSPAIQGALDAVAALPAERAIAQARGMATSQGVMAPGANTAVSVPQGNIGVRFAPGEGLNPRIAAQPIMEGGVQVGVGRLTPQQEMAQMRADLQKRHPNIFKAGTPENLAYVQAVQAAKAQGLGEDSVFKGVDNLMGGLAETKNWKKQAADAAPGNFFDTGPKIPMAPAPGVVSNAPTSGTPTPIGSQGVSIALPPTGPQVAVGQGGPTMSAPPTVQLPGVAVNAPAPGAMPTVPAGKAPTFPNPDARMAGGGVSPMMPSMPNPASSLEAASGLPKTTPSAQQGSPIATSPVPRGPDPAVDRTASANPDLGGDAAKKKRQRAEKVTIGGVEI